MRHVRGPAVPEEQVPVLSDDELRRLLKACEGSELAEWRDTALVMFRLDTGVRRGECAGMEVADVDLRTKTAHVLGKGRRPRGVAFGVKTARALDRYIRAATATPRRTHPTSGSASEASSRPTGSPGPRAPRRRGRHRGGLHAHRFRHTFAHTWLAEGGNEGDSWPSPAGAHDRCSPGTPPRPLPNEPGRRTAGFRLATALAGSGGLQGGTAHPCASRGHPRPPPRGYRVGTRPLVPTPGTLGVAPSEAPDYASSGRRRSRGRVVARKRLTRERRRDRSRDMPARAPSTAAASSTRSR
jgi:Phage integrase family